MVTREYAGLTEYSGGIGTQYASLAPALQRLGHEPLVVTACWDEPRTVVHEGVPVHLVRATRLGWSFAVDEVIRREGPFDVVYAPEWGGDAWRYSRRKDCGALVTNLTTSLEQLLFLSPEWKRPAGLRLHHELQKRRERTQARRSDALAPCTRVIHEWASELWQLDGIPSEVLPNMVDVQRVRSLAGGERPEGYPGGGPVVAFSGRLEIRKGPHVLVQAMQRVWDEVPRAQLVLFGLDCEWGSGRMSDHLMTLAGVHSSRLHVLGARPPDELFAGLAAADVVALPSLWENFALAALEALAIGCPIVATTGSGFGEFMEDGVNALLVPPRDPAALGETLLRLLRDPALRERLSHDARATAERYAAAPVAEQHARFFERVADNG